MTLIADEDARKQTCPLIRFCINEDDVLQNGNAPIYVHRLCQGSDCKIGWRWADPTAPVMGFCGAFGRPSE